MKTLALGAPGETLSVLCLGAQAGDIESGIGSTLLSWLSSGARLDVHWCVLSASGRNAANAYDAAFAFMAGAASKTIEVSTFREGMLTRQEAQLEGWFRALRRRVEPDIVFTHRTDDPHHDRRAVAKCTREFFRDHLIMEYQAAQGHAGGDYPNVYVPVGAAHVERKLTLLQRCYGATSMKNSANAARLRELALLRGLENRSPSQYADAFWMRRSELGVTLGLTAAAWSSDRQRAPLFAD